LSLRVTEKLRSLLIPSTRVVVFTGAGVSAESGIATFRGAQALWSSFRVEDYATPQAFLADPLKVWEWYNWRRREILKTGPNPGHLAICEFERYFKDFTLITQNVDGLHDQAGNQKILKLHGDIWETRCSLCGNSAIDTDARGEPLPPVCHCTGRMRPGVVWFGESLPEIVYERAVSSARRSGLFFSVGTSAEVYPAALLPCLAKQHGAYVVEVNIERTSAADLADEVLLGKSGEVLPGFLKYFAVGYNHGRRG
jgi:NAD-dependent deacetylase